MGEEGLPFSKVEAECWVIMLLLGTDGAECDDGYSRRCKLLKRWRNNAITEEQSGSIEQQQFANYCAPTAALVLTKSPWRNPRWTD